MTADCPCCKAQDVQVSVPGGKLRAHDRGFRGRARREQWRNDPCPASGMTPAEWLAYEARRATERPARWARQWRADGWFCIFWQGMVIVAPKTHNGMILLAKARTTPIERGEWAYAIDISQPPWRALAPADELRLADLLRRIARDCYCSSFPTSGCDFCNGTRLPDGAKEM